MTENVATPFVCSECRKLNQNWYAPCPHACLIVPLLATLQFISDGLHKAANGGFTGAGEKCTVGRLKNLIRNYRDVAAAAIASAIAKGEGIR